jgi:hypothetical protein
MKKQFYILSAFILAFVSAGKLQAQDCDCMIAMDSTFAVVPFNSSIDSVEFRNDDGSTAEMALPFTFNLYGVDHTSCFINNNGNVSFDNSYFTFTASGFPIDQYPMIAAFWADVDTRDAGSGVVYYKMTDHALIVRWDQVGYFPMMSDLLNDFQLIISDGTSELIPDGNNISFCYGDMQWTTGGASTGDNGFGGSPANVGANAGDGISFMQIGMFDAAGNAYDGAYNNNDGVDYLDYSHIFFTTNPIGANQPPIDVSNYCDTIILNPGDSTGFFFYDENADQNLSFELVTDYDQYLSISDGINGMIMQNGDLNTHSAVEGDRDLGTRSTILAVAANTPNGVYPFDMIITDDSATPISITIHHVVQVGPAIVNNVSKTVAPTQVNAYFSAGQLMFTGVKNSDINSITVYDAQGRNVFSGSRLNRDINTQTWPTGVYVFTLQTNAGTMTGRVIKQD